MSLMMTACLTLMLAGTGMAWNAPQDQWVCEEGNGWRHPYRDSYSIAVDDARVYVGTATNGIIVYDRHTRAELARFGSLGAGNEQFHVPNAIALVGNRLYVADRYNHRIQVLKNDGTFLFRWGERGTNPNEFLEPRGIAADTSYIYVCDRLACRVSVHRKDGTFVRMWGEGGPLPEQFESPISIAVDETFVYVSDGRDADFLPRVKVYTKQGKYVREWRGHYTHDKFNIAVDEAYVYALSCYPWNNSPCHLIVYDKEGREVWRHVSDNGPLAAHPLAIAPWGSRIYIADYDHGGSIRRIEVFHQIFRTLGSPQVYTNCAPKAEVSLLTQTPGTGILDIDYIVTDNDTPAVTAYPLVFTNATPSLASCLPMHTLVDGTEANVGTNVTVGVTNRISWNVGADWDVDYGDIRIAILAKDDRKLLDIHWLHMPAVDGNPALTINRYPITENDLLNLWFWVIASGNTAVSLADGEVRGTAGSGYDGELLADDGGTETRGREFLFDLLGISEATTDELLQAREASTPGSITKWDPRYKLPTGVPRKVNEFGFDTGSTDADGWWVVKE